MRKFIIEKNTFLLSKNIDAFFDLDYIGYQQEGNPDFINDLKNTFNNQSELLLQEAVDECYKYIFNFLKTIDLPNWAIRYPYYVCTVPRSKANFKPKQLMFKYVVRCALENLNRNDLRNGLDFIKRHTDVKTTHIKNGGVWNTGDLPYPGITKNSCDLSVDIKGKNIILIDDIYTKSINVIEDCIQALIDFGARNIIVYTVAYTVYKRTINEIF